MPVITKQELEDASVDAGTIEEVVNGDTTTTVTSRLGQAIKTLAKTIADAEATLADEIRVSSGIYETVSAGLAATTDGDYFSVVSGDNTEFLLFYSNNAGTAVQEKVYPSAFGVISRFNELYSTLGTNGLVQYTGSGDVWPVITDQNYRTILGYDESLEQVIAKGLINASEAYDQAAKLLTSFQIANYIGDGPVYPILVDQNFNVLLGYNAENNEIVGASVASAEAVPTTVTEALPAGLEPVPAAINHIMSYGQSLSVGAAGKPAISLTQPYSNLTFQGGPRAYDGTDYSFAPFKALVEDDVSPAPDGSTTRGETICSGAANYAITKAATDQGIIPSSHVILASAPGHGGYSITQLNKGTTWYNNVFLAHVQNAKTINSDYAAHVVSWMQGENDIGALMPYQTYYDHFIQLQSDIETDVKAISGQTSPVFIVTYQCSYKARAYPEIAKAQLDAVRNSDRFYMSTPMYHVPYAGDLVHLTNIGYKWVGAYVGRAYKQLMFDNIKPQYINPLSATRRGNQVTIKFSVPTAPLVLDTVTLAETTDFGFAVEDSVGLVTISSIAVQNSTEVVINLASTPSGTTVVRYAFDYLGTGLIINTGASGNLRDSTPDTITISGSSYPLYHVAPHFELPVIELGE